MATCHGQFSWAKLPLTALRSQHIRSAAIKGGLRGAPLVFDSIRFAEHRRAADHERDDCKPGDIIFERAWFAFRQAALRKPDERFVRDLT
jgi:hypothetical protein